jgi:hypothetical protein
MQRATAVPGSTVRWIVSLVAALVVLAGCGTNDDPATARATSPTGADAPAADGSTAAVAEPVHAVDVGALTPDTVCAAVSTDTVAAIVRRNLSAGEGTLGACEWKAPEAVRVRLFPPGEWSPDTGAGGYRELSGIGSAAYVAHGTFDNGYEAEALLGDRAVAAIIPADWATEDMVVALLRAAVERLR